MKNENTGWVCPKCGKVHSPLVKSCACVPPFYIPMAPGPKVVEPYYERYEYYPYVNTNPCDGCPNRNAPGPCYCTLGSRVQYSTTCWSS